MPAEARIEAEPDRVLLCRGRGCCSVRSAWIGAGLAVAVAALVTLRLPAHAGPDDRRTPKGSVVEGNAALSIDWTRGLIVARGAATGELRAPSPAVARVKAVRRARAQAREQLLERARTLSIHGKRVADHAEADEDVAARLSQAVNESLDVAVNYGSDGSVVLTVGLALEAVRLAVQGVPGAPTSPDQGPTAIVVDARRVLSSPILGIELARGDARYAGPTVFYRDRARAAKDPRAGKRIVRVTADSGEGRRLILSAKLSAKNTPTSDMLRSAAKAGPLVIIVIGKKK